MSTRAWDGAIAEHPPAVTRAVLVSSAANRRLARAAAWLGERRRDEEVVVLGASLEAAAEITRLVALRRGATFGWQRSTLGRAAAALAGPALAARGLAPVGALPLEALTARVVDALGREGALGRFAEVARFPGLPRALARTLADLRLAGVPPSALGEAGDELARVHGAYEEELARAGLADRALVFRLAATAAAGPGSPGAALLGRPLLLIDVPLAAALERDLVAALAARAPAVLAIAPLGDDWTIARLREALGVEPEEIPAASEAEPPALRRLQMHLFSGAQAPETPPADLTPQPPSPSVGMLALVPRASSPRSGEGGSEERLPLPPPPPSPERKRASRAARERGAGGVRSAREARGSEGLALREGSGVGFPRDDVMILSAPGESRECVEIARLVHAEAAKGVPFDRMAILLRAPAQYRAHLEEALRRASVPAHFARGTVQPDPAGRAFVALLACAAEGLSARRFAEYLSLGQVPDANDEGEPPAPPPLADRWVPADEELRARSSLSPRERERDDDAEPADRLRARGEGDAARAAPLGEAARRRRR